MTEGLSGIADVNQDGFITTAELTSYIDEMIPRLAQKVFGKEQFPTVNNGSQIFPVGRVR
ncbi:hypothetical protein KSF73_11955 [Burkholderiaceae bacterium DAT-1]|nr:hypothetical protein [Burkholderiaceae bacterium DAT-1]